MVIFRANFARNRSVLHWSDQGFQCFSNRGHHFALSTIRSRNEPMAKPLTSWLVPSFSQHNLRLVVLERCLHVSVTKFWHKFASLRQVNAPSSWDKFQNCYTDMYLIRFVPNFAVFCMSFWISWDFATVRNIRSPDNIGSFDVWCTIPCMFRAIFDHWSWSWSPLVWFRISFVS